MPTTSNLPIPPAARRILAAALDAVEPESAVRRALLNAEGETAAMLGAARRILVGALGKAAYPMARAAQSVLGERIARGVLVTKAGQLPTPLEGFTCIEAGHPIPNEASVRGAQALLELANSAEKDDLFLLLLSGGGSALATLPHPPLTLADLRATTELLLASGADIAEINTVRKHLDAFKGGNLARAAAPAALLGLVLSDVLGDRLDVIASGPAVPDPSTFAQAWAVLERRGLLKAAPPRVLAHLEAGKRGLLPETPKPGDPAFARVRHLIVGNVVQAAEAAVDAARGLGFHAAVGATAVQGEAAEAGKVLAAMLAEMAHRNRPLPRPACFVFGGETTVTLGNKHGLGGRNQELALAAVPHIAGLKDAWLISFATDGGDGPTDAAGAAADGETLSRARNLGLSPLRFLQMHDSYRFWETVGGLLKTGPTNTNVNDLTLLLTL